MRKSRFVKCSVLPFVLILCYGSARSETDVWQKWGLSGRNIYAVTARSSGEVFASTYDKVFRSSGRDTSWTLVASGLTAAYALATKADSLVFVGTYDGVFRSTNNGEDWTQVNNGLANPHVTPLTVSSSGQIYAGTYEGIYSSENNGETWTSLGLTNTYISSIAVKSDTIVFAGTAGEGIYRSTNSGASWAQINNGLIYSTQIIAIAVGPTGNVFAGDLNNGVFHSIDNGDNWIQVNQGLISTWITCLTISPSALLFAGTCASVQGFTSAGLRLRAEWPCTRWSC